MILRQVYGGPWKTLALLGLIWCFDPVGAWYKHVASPRYHTVGRASGLLVGIRRSPYLWRRGLDNDEQGDSLEPVPSLPANGAPQWLMEQRDLQVEEEEPWTTWGYSLQGLPWKGSASKRAFLHQAFQKSHGLRTLLDALQHQETAWAPQCAPPCHEAPGQRPAMYPELLERALRKKEESVTAEEASVFEPEMGNLMME